MPKKLYLIRHGQTEYNIQNRVQGWLDIPLNDTGHQQARHLLDVLKNDHIDVIYSSDLQRALQTAEPLAQTKQIPIHKSEKLRERDVGVFKGRTWDEIQQQTPNFYINFHDPNQVDWKEHQGESLREVSHRIKEFLDELEADHANDTVAIVTHRETEKAMLRLLGFEDLANNWDIHNVEVRTLEKDEHGNYAISEPSKQ